MGAGSIGAVPAKVVLLMDQSEQLVEERVGI
jgi:hypothetical protein